MDRLLIKSTKQTQSEMSETSEISGSLKRKSKTDRNSKKERHKSNEAWLKEFTWLNADDHDSVFCKVCQEYPLIADKPSTLFTGKKVDRKDSLRTALTDVEIMALKFLFLNVNVSCNKYQYGCTQRHDVFFFFSFVKDKNKF